LRSPILLFTVETGVRFVGVYFVGISGNAITFLKL